MYKIQGDSWGSTLLCNIQKWWKWVDIHFFKKKSINLIIVFLFCQLALKERKNKYQTMSETGVNNRLCFRCNCHLNLNNFSVLNSFDKIKTEKGSPSASESHIARVPRWISGPTSVVLVWFCLSRMTKERMSRRYVVCNCIYAWYSWYENKAVAYGGSCLHPEVALSSSQVVLRTFARRRCWTDPSCLQGWISGSFPESAQRWVHPEGDKQCPGQQGQARDVCPWPPPGERHGTAKVGWGPSSAEESLLILTVLWSFDLLFPKETRNSDTRVRQHYSWVM